MTVSPALDAAIADLRIATRALLAELRDDEADAERWADIAHTVTRYLQMVEQAMTAGDAATARTGLNLLTTVNKGVADREASPRDAALGAKAFAVSRAAIEAAKCLRDDDVLCGTPR
jgi:hypothetical protein